MPITNMPFGNAGGLDSVTLNRSFGELEIPHGAEKEVFFLETEIGIATEKTICGSAGIAENKALGTGGSGNYSSVVLTEVEDIQVKKVPRQPGISLELQDGRLLKALEACFMILGYTHTVALSGRGVPVLTGDDQGDKPGQIVFASALGLVSITSHADAKVKPLSETRPPTGAWTWTTELAAYITNETPSAHPLSVPAEVSALIPTNTVYQIQHTLTMNEYPNTPTEAYTITAHPTT